MLPAGAAPPHAQHRSIDDGYFATLGVPVVAGRNFAAHEAEPVVIVDENARRRNTGPDGSALGQRLAAAIGSAGSIGPRSSASCRP